MRAKRAGTKAKLTTSINCTILTAWPRRSHGALSCTSAKSGAPDRAWPVPYSSSDSAASSQPCLLSDDQEKRNRQQGQHQTTSAAAPARCRLGGGYRTNVEGTEPERTQQAESRRQSVAALSLANFLRCHGCARTSRDRCLLPGKAREWPPRSTAAPDQRKAPLA